MIMPDALEREAFLTRVCPLDRHTATDPGALAPALKDHGLI
ncbi:MAG: hypothetical protein ACK53I_14960 [Phenylobacterium sp.]